PQPHSTAAQAREVRGGATQHPPAQSSQNSSLSANWIMRFAYEVAVEPKLMGFRVCVIFPNAGSLILRTGIAKWGVLVRLKISVRNWRRKRSLMGMSLMSPRSKLT